MPHVSKKYPLIGHGVSEDTVGMGAAVDRKFRNHPANMRTGYMDTDILSGSETSEGNICEEGGDCADRVNAEDYEQDGEARQILQDAKRVAESRRKRVV